MRKLLMILSAFLACCSTDASAIGTSVKLGGETAEFRLIRNETAGAAVEVWRDGKLTQTFENLGESFLPIDLAGKKMPLVTLDTRKEGFEKVVVRTAQPPYIGSLWVFEWDKKEKKFAHVLDERGDRSLPVPLSTVVRLENNGELRYQLPASQKVKTLRWNGRGFK